MTPEDVPVELSELGTRAVDMHPSTSFLAPCESLARAVLAAVLPEHEQQVRERMTEEMAAERAEIERQVRAQIATEARITAANLTVPAEAALIRWYATLSETDRS